MKSILLLVAMLTLGSFSAHAGARGFVSFGGGGAHFQGACFSPIGSRCAYSAGCYPYRSCRYFGYPSFFYGGYGYYGGYAASYYPSSYSDESYAPPITPETPPAPPTSEAVSSAPIAPPAKAPLLFGILDVNGFVHSPYSDATFKVPNVRNAQMVYDPVTGKPFLVR